MAESSLITERIGNVALVSFRDASMLDAVTIQKIARELYAIVEDESNTNVVLDFTHVRFLSSQALGVLLTVRRKADRKATKVVLCKIRPELARVFKVTNLDKMFEFHDSTEQALAGFRQASASDDSSS
ncbi:MAG: STAS domain-containing protein [Planctomycetes bacterium]|nr:STAS domain-containing protein [Planctomycetota bacterium]